MSEKKKSFAARAAEYRIENIHCAKKVLQDPERYGAGMVTWARMVLAVPDIAAGKPTPLQTQPAADRHGQGQLF